MKTTSTAAFFAQALLASTSRSKKVCQCSVPRRAWSARHCCALNEDGAQRAASKSRINSSSEISSPDIARGDQRSSKSDSIGRSAFRTVLPLISLLSLAILVHFQHRTSLDHDQLGNSGS